MVRQRVRPGTKFSRGGGGGGCPYGTRTVLAAAVWWQQAALRRRGIGCPRVARGARSSTHLLDGTRTRAAVPWGVSTVQRAQPQEGPSTVQRGADEHDATILSSSIPQPGEELRRDHRGGPLVPVIPVISGPSRSAGDIVHCNSSGSPLTKGPRLMKPPLGVIRTFLSQIE